VAEDRQKAAAGQPHNVILEERRVLTVSGVQDVDSYDEQSIVAFTELGELTIKGEGLHINKIDVQTGELNVEGEIWELCYSNLQKSQQGLFSRLFR
jgi:sporulation protein YabP